MMHRIEKTYFLAGALFSEKSLVAHCHQQLANNETPDFEKDIFRFIIDWFGPDDDMIVRTSGSTGKPKEISLLKKHMEASARATIDFFHLKIRDVILHCLPMQFIAGKMMVVRALAGGLDLYLAAPSSRPEIIPGKVAFTAMVPMQLSNLLQTKKGKASLSGVEKLIIGGSFISANLLNEIQELSTDIWQTYGMTETITHIALRKINGKNKTEWYKPLPGVSVSLNNKGCLEIDAPEIGVHQLATNDLAQLNEERNFKITGRTDHVIISGGKKFYPETIEQKISEEISYPFFIGSEKDDVLGERLVLFIEVENEVKPHPFMIWQALEKKLTAHEIPKEIIFVSKFTRTVSGKINRVATIKGTD